MSRWFTAAFGSSVTSRKGAMIIFQSPRSGMLHIASGGAYFVAKGTDWWEPFYPPDNMQRPTVWTL